MKRLILLLTLTLLCLCALCACDGEDAGNGDGTAAPPAVCQHRDTDDNSLCDKCGESYTDGIDVMPHTHAYGAWSTTTPATCQAKGEETRSCACGEDETRELAIDPDAHTYNEENTCACLHYKDTGVSFVIENGTYVVADYTGAASVVIIPSTYKGVAVTAIGSDAFRGCTGLTSITIPSSVTSIGSYAFDECTGLKTVTFAEGSQLTSIGDWAFSGCTGLTSITIPSSVTSIGDWAFPGCTGLKTVTFAAGSKLTSIGECAFYDCMGLQKVVISDIAAWCNISFSDEYANPLYYAKHLYLGENEITNLIIPSSVTSIGEYAFFYCTGLKTVTFTAGSKLTSIGSSAFEVCTGLTSITIPSSVTSIDDDAFYGCTGLLSITIPSSVTSIGDDAFYGCYKLIEVYNLSATLTITARDSGNGCVGCYAKNVYTDTTGSSKLFTTTDGYVFFDDGTNRYLMGYTGNGTVLTLPADCKGNSYEIYEYAFYKNTNMTSVTIPSSVTSIGDHAFFGCTGLKNVTFENTTGWWRSYFSTATSGTSIASVDLAHTSIAATYLTSTYYDYYWKRG